MHPNGWMDPALMYAMQMQHASGYYAHHPHHHHHVASANPPLSNASTAPNAAAASDFKAATKAAESYPSSEETPQKKPADFTQSPFWSHLDRATLALGLATPAKSSPLTPSRADETPTDPRQQQESSQSAVEETATTTADATDETGFAVNAQPLLLQHGQYYGYNSGGVVRTVGS